MVRRVGGPGNYIAMVVDDTTLNVLSSCCSVYDVLNDGVTSKPRRHIFRRSAQTDSLIASEAVFNWHDTSRIYFHLFTVKARII